MKTLLKASGIGSALAFMSAIGLVGCGADMGAEGAAGEGEIGSTSQAIVVADVLAPNAAHDLTINIPSANTDKFHTKGGFCTIGDATATYLMVAGGRVPGVGATVTDQIHLINTNGTPVNAEFDYGDPTSHLKLVQDPSNAARCLGFGGKNAANAKTTVIKALTLTHSGATPTITVTDAGRLNTALAEVEVIPCGTGGNLMVIGGDSGAASDIIQIWDSGKLGTTTALPNFKNDNASPANVTLSSARFGHSVTAESLQLIVVAGGAAGGARLASVEAMKLKSGTSCTLDSTSLTTAINVTAVASTAGLRNGAGSPAAQARTNGVGFYDSSRGHVFATGDIAGAPGVSKAEDVITVDFANWPTLSGSSGATSLPTNLTATKAGTFVSGPSREFLLVSGDGVAAISHYDLGVWSTVTTRTDASALNVRFGAVGFYVPGSDTYFVGLGGPANFGSFLKTMEEIQTP